MESTSAQPTSISQPSTIDIHEAWHALNQEEKFLTFVNLPRADADDFFLSLAPRDQSDLILAFPDGERRIWVRLLPPDDLADVIQETEPEKRSVFLHALDIPTRNEVTALLAYKEDEAGGLMNPRFVRSRPEMTVDEAIKYLRKQAPHVETTRYIYVLGQDQTLLGVVSLRLLFTAEGSVHMKDLMRTSVITANDKMSQEDIKTLFKQSALMAIPVLDDQNHMKGIVTVDDVVDVVEEEATEDIQRLGGSEVLDAPYLNISILQMIKKRGVWLVVLFLGETLTASAIGFYEHELEQAIVLALFIPLIISSGGNSGSQASTLVVRAIALREIRLRDWWRVFSRELFVGTALGAILGSIGLAKILFWPTSSAIYGEHFALIGITVSLSLVGIVLWGSLCGSMLPFVLKKLRLDPATASAPFVATLVDVSGLVIYFSFASLILKGTLL